MASEIKREIDSMNTKNDIEVTINNKKYVLCGYESNEYLQKVALYLNQKIDEFKEQEGYNRLDTDMKNVLMQINVADDYFKAQREVAELQEDSERKDNEIFDLKHEMISYQTQVEALQKDLEKVENDYLEAEKKIIRLETELEERTTRKINK